MAQVTITDEQFERLLDKIGQKNISVSKTDGSTRRVVEALIIGSILGLAGTLWALSMGLNTLKSTVEFHDKAISQNATDIRTIAGDMRQIEGRVQRSIDEIANGEAPKRVPGRR